MTSGRRYFSAVAMKAILDSGTFHCDCRNGNLQAFRDDPSRSAFRQVGDLQRCEESAVDSHVIDTALEIRTAARCAAFLLDVAFVAQRKQVGGNGLSGVCTSGPANGSAIHVQLDFATLIARKSHVAPIA